MYLLLNNEDNIAKRGISGWLLRQEKHTSLMSSKQMKTTLKYFDMKKRIKMSSESNQFCRVTQVFLFYTQVFLFYRFLPKFTYKFPVLFH